MKKNGKFKNKVIIIDIQRYKHQTKNNGPGDICLITEEYQLPGTTLGLIFNIPETIKEIEVSGEIVSSEYFIEEDYCCNYIKFISVKDEDKDLINEFINNVSFDIRKSSK